MVLIPALSALGGAVLGGGYLPGRAHFAPIEQFCDEPTDSDDLRAFELAAADDDNMVAGL